MGALFRLSLLLLLAGGLPAAAQDASPTPGWQATPWADSVMVESQLFFSMASPDGKGVSEQQWQQFLTDTILPRFTDGLTILDAYGVSRGATGSDAALSLARPGTRMLLLVHPNTPDAQAKLSAIKAAYVQRFSLARVFHVDFPVRTRQ